jgi:hypothetical protein
MAQREFFSSCARAARDPFRACILARAYTDRYQKATHLLLYVGSVLAWWYFR